MNNTRIGVNKKKKKGRKKKVILPKKDLTMTAFSVIMNKKKNCYELVILKYDLSSKQAYVKETKYLADTIYRAEFELKKMLAHGNIIKLFKENENA